jgi:hypothetical protein
MEAIAALEGVGKSTIARDLEEFSHDGKTQQHASRRGRKGEGRPKGSKRPRGEKKNFTMEAIATQLGVSTKTISFDLKEFLPEVKTSRPKGGRPKGQRPKPKPGGQQRNDRRRARRARSGVSPRDAAAICELLPVSHDVKPTEPGPQTSESDAGGSTAASGSVSTPSEGPQNEGLPPAPRHAVRSN